MYVDRKCGTLPPLTDTHTCLNTHAYSLHCFIPLCLLSSQRYLPHLSATASAGSAPHATALWLTVKEVIL